MRICKMCGNEKPLEAFDRQGVSKKTGKMLHRWQCMDCRRLKYRPPTGKPPFRFKKGQVPWNKGLKGSVPWNKGKRPSEETLKKMSNTWFKKGSIPIAPFKKGIVPWSKLNKGKYATRTRGTGITKGSWRYKNWRKMVLERDNYTCQKCSSLENLRVHHIKCQKKYPELKFEVDNGLTLCISCHMRLHYDDEKINKPGNKKANSGSFKKGNVPMAPFKKGHVPWNKGKRKGDLA